ncbi:YhcG family protein [Xenophilus aerolatus]
MSKPSHYAGLLAEVKQHIQAAQSRAALAVNRELIRLYWQIGGLLDARQAQEGWGAGVIPRLARDIRNELPEVKGFSERNIDRMLAFARAYPRPVEFSPQPVAKLPAPRKAPQAVAKTAAEADSLLWQIPWGHHALMLEKLATAQLRRWYMAQTVAQGWSRSTLALQISAQAHARQGRAVSNFADRLPAPQSDLVRQALKDPYVFDFLTLEPDFHERELETGLVRHVEKFLLELGQGFSFVGRQYRLAVGDSEFYIDLLFYHLKLRCFVVIELKRGDFKPEYAGKLNFYCNVVDDTLRHPQDAPTIGLMLCQRKDQVLAEYALRGIDKPCRLRTDARPAAHAGKCAAQHRDAGGRTGQGARSRTRHPMNASSLGQKIWKLCHSLRDDGAGRRQGAHPRRVDRRLAHQQALHAEDAAAVATSTQTVWPWARNVLATVDLSPGAFP